MMSKKPIIAIDLDDVLADSTEAIRLEVNKRLGVDLKPEHYKVMGDYDLYYTKVWEQHGISDRISFEELNPQMRADQSHIQPSKDAAVVLRSLTLQYKLIVVTGRSSLWRKQTEKWLKKYFPGIFEGVYFGKNETGGWEKTKGVLCADQGASWLIDDNIDHARTAIESGVNVVLFGDYGWQLNTPNDMIRCKDWHAVGEFFNGQS